MQNNIHKMISSDNGLISNCGVVTNRYPEIDEWRGVFLIGMTLYHSVLFYYLCHGEGSVILNDYKWKIYQKLVASSFFFISGICYSIQLYKPSSYIYIIIKCYPLVLCCIVVSSMSYYLHGMQHMVYFGILHCILVCKILSKSIVRHKNVCLIIGILVILISLNIKSPFFDTFLKFTGLGVLPNISFDFQPFFPYFGVFLLGSWLSHYITNENITKISVTTVLNFLKLIGKNSLLYYMAHVPIIGFIVYLICNH